MAFEYNDDGIRTSKTVNGVEHIYHLHGSRIVSEEWGNHLLLYIYDAEGTPIGMQYRKTTYAANEFDTYWFEKNLQGDIVAVYSEDGTKLISYTYDAWGNFTTTYSNGGAATTATYNPFTYRGYYYDAELELYYLNSRYYDSNTGRFINADVYINANGDILGFNMFAYCGNNPVMGYDPSGEVNWSNILKATAVVVAITAIVALSVATAGSAAIALGVSATVVKAATVGAVIGGLVAGSSEIVGQCITEGSDNLDYNSIAIETSMGSLMGAIDGVAATTSSLFAQIGSRIGRVGVSGSKSVLHSINNGDTGTETLINATKSMALSAAIQGSVAYTQSLPPRYGRYSTKTPYYGGNQMIFTGMKRFASLFMKFASE